MPVPGVTGGQTVGVTVRAVLFDFGNTLFAHAALPEVIVAEARSLGHRVTGEWAAALAERVQHDAHTPDELAHPRDLDMQVWAARWPVLYAAGDGVVPGLGAALYRSMHDPVQWHPYAATAHTLQVLRTAGVPVGVVSNTGWDIRAVFAHHRLGPSVSTFVLSCDVGVTKPSADIFVHACRELGVAPEETLMVGDDAVADAGAVRAGLTTLLLPALPPHAANGVDAALRIANVS